MLTMYFVPSFHLNLKRSLKSHTISFQRIRHVLNTVAMCTMMVKSKAFSGSTPNKYWPMAK